MVIPRIPNGDRRAAQLERGNSWTKRDTVSLVSEERRSQSPADPDAKATRPRVRRIRYPVGARAFRATEKYNPSWAKPARMKPDRRRTAALSLRARPAAVSGAEAARDACCRVWLATLDARPVVQGVKADLRCIAEHWDGSRVPVPADLRSRREPASFSGDRCWSGPLKGTALGLFAVSPWPQPPQNLAMARLRKSQKGQTGPVGSSAKAARWFLIENRALRLSQICPVAEAARRPPPPAGVPLPRRPCGQ